MDPSPTTEPRDRRATQIWRFANFEFDDGRRELRIEGRVVDVEAKPLEVLRQLLLHAGEVVTKDELLDLVWPGLTVVDSSLATAVSKLRRALGAHEGIIVTVSRVGYRLAGPVHTRLLEPAASTELHLKIGDPVLGREQWRLVRRLDTSPSSEVWLAEHTKTRDRRVFKFAADPEQLRGLKREVTLARLLRETLGERPEFVRLHEWNFSRPPYFIESEYAGPTLAEWAAMAGGLSAIPLAERLTLFGDIARAVGAAHSIDVLHKDIKPGNILVSSRPDGSAQIKIADFGSAALLTTARLSALGITNLGFTHPGGQEGALTGTAIYLAPEVLAGESPSPASDVYALGVLLYQLVIGDFKRPLAPGWEGAVTDPLIREDIAQAADGDPSRRFPTANELATHVANLEPRRAEHETREREEERARQEAQKRARTRLLRPWVAGTALAVAAAVATLVIVFARSPAVVAPPSQKRVAVLPFRNLDADSSFEYLRIALADEVVTILSHSREIAVRPLSASSRFDDPSVDLKKTGQDLNVDTVVTGYYSKVNGGLRIALEATDAAQGTIVWRDQMEAPAESAIAMQMQLALRVQNGLAPALGSPATDATPAPKNEAAYALFLQSIALPLDPEPGAKAVAMLEQSIALDPTYAPAWLQLGRRYYVEHRYAKNNPALFRRAQEANERALALDPGSVTAMANVVGTQIERGDLLAAHERIQGALERRPDSADAHFSLSYVLRFAGLLEEAATECERALFLDAATLGVGLRSCAVVFILRSDYTRALNYLHLARGTDFEKALTIHMLLRQGKEAEALALGVPQMPQWTSYPLVLACAAHKPARAIADLTSQVAAGEDPETNYFAAAHLAYCGQTNAALELLSTAVKGGYCSYPAITTDPMFASVRESPAFAAVRADAAACQQRFIAGRTSSARYGSR